MFLDPRSSEFFKNMSIFTGLCELKWFKQLIRIFIPNDRGLQSDPDVFFCPAATDSISSRLVETVDFQTLPAFLRLFHETFRDFPQGQSAQLHRRHHGPFPWGPQNWAFFIPRVKTRVCTINPGEKECTSGQKFMEKRYNNVTIILYILMYPL